MRHVAAADIGVLERIIRQAEEAGMLVLPMRQGRGFVIVPQQGTEKRGATADERRCRWASDETRATSDTSSP
jgi:hypothetical protein